MEPVVCQLISLQQIAEGNVKVGPLPLSTRVYVAFTRPLSPGVKKVIKRYMSYPMNWYYRLTGQKTKPSTVPESSTRERLRAGDWVRVRSEEEIRAILDPWNQFRGCGVLDGMWQYCGTTQRVLKPLEIFLDERDYRVKRCRGIVLLEGLMCQGTREFGRCDRSCLFFWREEWLEKTDDGEEV